MRLGLVRRTKRIKCLNSSAMKVIFLEGTKVDPCNNISSLGVAAFPTWYNMLLKKALILRTSKLAAPQVRYVSPDSRMRRMSESSEVGLNGLTALPASNLNWTPQCCGVGELSMTGSSKAWCSSAFCIAYCFAALSVEVTSTKHSMASKKKPDWFVALQE